jgi:hypothetical protein
MYILTQAILAVKVCPKLRSRIEVGRLSSRGTDAKGIWFSPFHTFFPARLGGVTLGGSLFGRSLLRGSLFGGSLIFPYIYHTNNKLLYKSIPNTMNTSLP